jgi:hypothetical protein
MARTSPGENEEAAGGPRDLTVLAARGPPVYVRHIARPRAPKAHPLLAEIGQRRGLLRNRRFSMDNITREKFLKIALVAFGAIFFTIYPLGLIWPSGWLWHGGHANTTCR